MNISDNIKSLKPTDLNCNIFSVYDYEELSLQELLCKFFTKINDCIEISNKAITFLEYLYEIGVSEEVAKILNEMYESGKLSAIINEELFGELNKRIKTLEIKYCVSVTDFGAIGDGVTDNTNAIQMAIDTICGKYDLVDEKTAHNGGGVVFIPRGNYLVSSTIFIPSNVTLKGEGRTTFSTGVNSSGGTTITYTGASNKPCISFLNYVTGTHTRDYRYAITGADLDARTNIPTYNGCISDLTLNCLNKQDVGIVFGGCPQSSIVNVKIQGFLCGIITSSCWGAKIENVFSYTSHCGMICYKSNNLLSVKDFYTHENGLVSSISSSSRLYEYVSDETLPQPNTPTGIYIIRGKGINFVGVTIESWRIGVQTGNHSSNQTSWNGVWIERPELPFYLYGGSHSFYNVSYLPTSENIEYLFTTKDTTKLIVNNCRGSYNFMLNDIDDSCVYHFVNYMDEKITKAFSFSGDVNNNIVPLKSTYNLGKENRNWNNGYFQGTIKIGVKHNSYMPTPSSDQVGTMVINSSSKKLLWWDGSTWYDVMGNKHSF